MVFRYKYLVQGISDPGGLIKSGSHKQTHLFQRYFSSFDKNSFFAHGIYNFGYRSQSLIVETRKYSNKNSRLLQIVCRLQCLKENFEDSVVLHRWLHLIFSSRIINFGYRLDLLFFSPFTILLTFDWIILAFGPFAFGPYDEQTGGNIFFHGSHCKDGGPLPLGIHANRSGADIMKNLYFKFVH